MSLHGIWTEAKKDSKAKFKTAHKAKREELEKKIKAGDKNARAKVLAENLAAMGMAKGDDLDKYFTFREDFGPNLDRLEKARRGAPAAGKPLTMEHILGNAKLAAAFGAFAKSKGSEEEWLFYSRDYKGDPAKVYATYLARSAPKLINVDQKYVQPLHALAGNPAQLKAQGPALLKACRDSLTGGDDPALPDLVMKFATSKEYRDAVGAPADTTDLEKKIADTIGSYRRQITGYEAKWKSVQPDFRKPLLDALARIEAAI